MLPDIMSTETQQVNGLTQTVAEVIAASLKRRGIRNIFGQSLPSELILAAEKEGIRQVVYRTENAGGAMADGFARASGTIGVVAAQNGPAATLLVPPLAEAMKASIPVLALLQEVPRKSRDRNAFQEIDHVELFGACSKRVSLLDCPERIEEDLDLAIVEALSGRPGPVVVLLPRDVLSMEGASVEGGGSSAEFPLDRPRPDAASVAVAAEMLRGAARPLIIAGGGVHASGGTEALAELQEIASIPVGTTTMGKGSVDERHELSLGMITSFMGAGSLSRRMGEYVADADVIMFVGSRTNENGTDAWTLFPEDGCSYIHLDMDPVEVGRNYPSVRLVGDARAGIEALLDALKDGDLATRGERRPQLASFIVSARRRDRVSAAHLLSAPDSPIRPERVMAELDKVGDSQTIYVADASYSTIWVAAYLTARRAGQRFITPRGLAGLGWGLPLAVGVQASEPESKVVCIVGDGGFAHCWSELETIAREQLPVTIVVLNNAILGFQKHAELHKLGAHTTAVDHSRIDHCAIARACGVAAELVSDPEELEGAFVRNLNSGRPGLVEVDTDARAYPPIKAWDDSPTLWANPRSAEPNGKAA